MAYLNTILLWWTQNRIYSINLVTSNYHLHESQVLIMCHKLSGNWSIKQYSTNVIYGLAKRELSKSAENHTSPWQWSRVPVMVWTSFLSLTGDISRSRWTLVSWWTSVSLTILTSHIHKCHVFCEHTCLVLPRSQDMPICCVILPDCWLARLSLRMM